MPNPASESPVRSYAECSGRSSEGRPLTQREWVTAQCRAYIERLEAAATELALGQGLFRQRDDLLPGLRLRLAGHHYVFCLPQTEGPAVVLAILHERMDLITRLKERLD